MPVRKLRLGDLALWQHQHKAIKMCERYFAAGTSQAALVQLPTGTGKTGVMAALASLRSLEAPVLVVCPSAALVDQLRREFDGGFWNRLGADPNWTPEHVLHLLPSEIDKIEDAIDSAKGNERVVAVGTIQALQQLHITPAYSRICGQFGTVMFDEGHREPAPAWADAVRGLGAATILFSATPFRNDLKYFDVDLGFVEFLSFQEAVSDGLIRGVQIEEIDIPDGAAAFANYVVKFRDELIRRGQFAQHNKMIIRADNADDVRSLFSAFAEVLAGREEGILGVHNTFTLSGQPGRQLRSDVPENLRDRTERFLVHQFMLAEGIDDPACTMLALYEPFSTERQLVQQVGRLTRHPGTIGDSVPPAVVITKKGDDVGKMWGRFLAFDEACVRNGGRPPLRNDQQVFKGLVEALPEVDYISGKFRTRLELNEDVSDDLRVPRSAIVFDVSDDFDIDDFTKEVSRALNDEDRFEIDVGSVAKGQCSYHLTLRLLQSPFLNESLFQSASLEVTIYARHGHRLFLYDSAGLWIDDADLIRSRLDPESMRMLLPDGAESVVTSIAMKNTDLGPLAIRSRSLSARSLERSGVFMGEHLNVLTRAAGRVGEVRRSVGFARSRVRQGEGNAVTGSEFLAWTEEVAKELNRQPVSAPIFKRFATPTGVPADTTPKNILVDLDAFVGEFFNENEKEADFDLDSVCQDVVPDSEGPEDFLYRFELVIDRHPAPVWMKWDRKKQKYWIRSDHLSGLKLKDNPRITLTHRLNQQQPFRIIPAEAATTFAFGRFYASDLDLARAGGAGSIVLNLIQGVPGLENITSEKGDLSGPASSWPRKSLFGFIDRALLARAGKGKLGPTFPAVVCDDIGQEAADFIAADSGSDSGLPRAVLIAAKWKEGKPGVSASALYDVCGQVVKNLAYLKVDAIELPGTPGRWNQPWRLKGASVPRVRVGPKAAAFRKLFMNARANPATQRQMWMVLGGGILSRRALEKELKKPQPAPHVLQLYHLLLSTYAACQSIGVDLKIFSAE